MDSTKTTYKTVDEYIQLFPKDVQEVLQAIRKLIREEAPEAVEMISYQMPAFKLKGRPLVYFAAWKSHIGFYATPSGNEKFKKEIAKYKQAKGSIQFPLSEPMPLNLIRDIVRFRVQENLARAKK